MMKNLFLFSMIVVVTFTDVAFAQTTPAPATPTTPSATPATPSTTTPSTTPAAGGDNSCNFDAYKQSLYRTESSAGERGYYMTNASGAAGKYQFMPDNRASYLRNHPECNPNKADCSDKPGGGTVDQCMQSQACGWRSRACIPVQECLQNHFSAADLKAIRASSACQKLMGTTITGYRKDGRTNGPCQVTESGLLAAFHLGGPDECRKIAANGRGDADGMTHTSWYVCAHGNIPVPSNCTPSAAATPPTTTDTDTYRAVGTQAELDFATGGGDTSAMADVGGPIDALREWWVGGLMLMARQFTANMELQVMGVGKLFDAKHQMETQRLFQEKQARAHKDYQPSEQMCTFGTFTRGLVATQRSADLTKAAVASSIMQRELGTGNAHGQTTVSDSLSRIAKFRTSFCNQGDNANGLSIFCPNGGTSTAAAAALRNADINFTTSIDQPLSLRINLTDTETTPDEEAVFALIDNLFMHDVLPRVPANQLEQRNFQYHYMNMRSIVAMRGIARNSIANIIALKTALPTEQNQTTAAPYMRALFRDFGLQDQEITTLLGDNPSYYAQMELLTKKIYQSPSFYTGLYDKPVNVERVRAAMKAIKLMQDRDIQASLQRREMLLSMILEIRLRERAEAVYNATERAMYGNP